MDDSVRYGGAATINELPTPIPTNGNYQVTITKVENGFIVSVGCKMFVSQSWAEISSGLELYYANPKEAIAQFLKK